MKKPQIIVESDKRTTIWGYSYKDCIDYIKNTFDISSEVYNDLMSWGDPFYLEYPFFIIFKSTEDIKNPYEHTAEEILTNLYGFSKVKHKDQLIDTIKILYEEFNVKHTIEDIPIVSFLKF